ncbi:MAG: HD domain-containing phosphohydrolase [Gemmatimonadaceae bacterium]
MMMFSLPSGGVGTIAFIPFLALLLVAPHWTSAVSVGLAHIVAEGLSRRHPLKAIFNIAQMSFAVALGALCYLVGGGESILGMSLEELTSDPLTFLVPFLLMTVVFFVVNTLSVSGAIAVSEGKSVLRVWRKNTLHSVVYDILAAPVVLLLGWAFARTGPFGAICLSIPLVGVRQLYSTTAKLEQVNQELLQLMVKAIEARDPYTSGHSRRVAHYSKIIARAIGLTPRRIERVGTAALLHDVGKIHEMYAPILSKPDKLTPDEWAIMQTHPIRSAELVATVSNLRDLIGPLRHHHENWDGSGYPDGLGGEEIPLESRIIMFADTIDAMTTDRPYRQARGETEVRSELIRQRGRQFDPTICDLLLASPLWSLLFVPELREPTPVSTRAVLSVSGRLRRVVGA